MLSTLVFSDTMTKVKKEDAPWIHDDWDVDLKLYNKKTDTYTDLNEEQTKHALQWIKGNNMKKCKTK